MRVFEHSSRTRTFLPLVFFAAAVPSSLARGPLNKQGPPAVIIAQAAKAAGCSPARTITELDLNNVRTVVETGGNMWEDRALGKASYEVPRTPDRSGASSMFAGGLWMGGLSPDNQLKLAAVLYRANGNDYWPGPLTNTGDASVTSGTCTRYDRTFRTRRQDAARHDAYYRCINDPGCDLAEEFPDPYVIPPVYLEWPAMGDVGAGQDFHIAPFLDLGADDSYDPERGDRPAYDLVGAVDCGHRKREDVVPLFGDENIWWVFNDKGNAHSESGGQPIGMEIRAQAFAYSTNDELNNMTFYNYTLINQGTQTLTRTYFGQYADPDLGGSSDDLVGCDVQRGLGYCYNGDDNDEDDNGTPGYGPQPPAVGIDFFEGPFQDYDKMDNPGPTDSIPYVDCATATAEKGITYKGIGIGYGDHVPDNERYGMRAFIYFSRQGASWGNDPAIAVHFYNYMRGFWKDGTRMTYDGTGVAANYMFPGDSDPQGWGTGCTPQADWSDGTPSDRRFVQSAGPFTLDPGAYNNITVGVVWARANSGGPLASVEALRTADDKAQALFDNCFRVLDGPVAPDLSIQELDRELLLYVSNAAFENNANESYDQIDPTIPSSATDRSYRFEGYQIYQVKDAVVSASELRDINKARIVAQCDVKNGVASLINYLLDPDLGLPVPTEMVRGADGGIRHSFRITTDLFASGDTRLTNFKTYHYMAVAYAHNNWQDYDPVARTGQPRPYLASRRGARGSIRSYAGIPHIPSPEADGTDPHSQYDDHFAITRLGGQGQGALPLELSKTTMATIMNGAPWRADELRYNVDFGPVEVKVIDPLNVPQAAFELWFHDSTPADLSDATWTLVNTTSGESVNSDRTIAVANEQLIPRWGLSITVAQEPADTTFTQIDGFDGLEMRVNEYPIEARMSFADPDRAWLGGIPDGEENNAFNWIRSGSSFIPPDTGMWDDRAGLDPDQRYEKLIGGTWAPWVLCGDHAFQPATETAQIALLNYEDLRDLPSVTVVITPEKDQWSRAPVFEMGTDPALAEGGAHKLDLRAHPSVDRNGDNDGSGNGMGWFPGYAIDMNTGERLNIGFGEDSYWGGSEGRNMLWDPSDVMVDQLGSPRFGGQHWIYVFRNARRMDALPDGMPQYDGAMFIEQKMNGSTAQKLKVWRSIAWVGSAMLVPEHALLESEVRIRLNVERPYEKYTQPFGAYDPAVMPQRNGGLPLYAFDTEEEATHVGQLSTARSALDLIGVVPNPYYAFSGYESSRLDDRVKFINLPVRCAITIYNAAGALVRKYSKDNDLTYLDWDLKNSHNVPIAGGTYICHVDAPGIGECVIKWFGVPRPVDLQNF